LRPGTERRILDRYNRTRGSLPRAHSVHARENRRRIVSVTGGGRDVRLNVAVAVVEAGPRAWVLLGPALAGDREATRRLRDLAAEGLRKARARSRNGDPPRSGHPLPDTACDGSAAEQRILRAILRWALATQGCEDLLPGELQVRVSRRMTRTFGTHRTRGGVHRISIAQRLFRPGLEDLLLDTVLHELAHLLDAVTNGRGRSGHGPSWKAWCRRLGARPRRLAGQDDARRVESAEGADGPGRMPEPVAAWLTEGGRT
jgi:hypothetical protein